tara:strand:- start:9029 stop:9565 length:537 start_codon:yes stop_codon:yes gene_type:complete
MKNFLRALFFVLTAITLACSGAKEAPKTNTSSTNSLYPAWYGGFEFNTDSTSFFARATAVADDAETAKLRADKEARALLESYIAKELEDIRSELERDGSSVAKKPDFILMLRNAHYKIEEVATISNLESVENGGVFRGFAHVVVRKEKVRSLIETGLSTNSNYQKEFVGSVSFQEFIK